MACLVGGLFPTENKLSERCVVKIKGSPSTKQRCRHNAHTFKGQQRIYPLAGRQAAGVEGAQGFARALCMTPAAECYLDSVLEEPAFSSCMSMCLFAFLSLSLSLSLLS